MSPLQPPPACWTYPAETSRSSFDPNFGILSMSHCLLGLCLIPAPTGMIGPLKSSVNRILYAVSPSDLTSCMFLKKQKLPWPCSTNDLTDHFAPGIPMSPLLSFLTLFQQINLSQACKGCVGRGRRTSFRALPRTLSSYLSQNALERF